MSTAMMMPFPQPEAYAIKPIAHGGPDGVENQVLLRHAGAEYELAALDQHGKEKAPRMCFLFTEFPCPDGRN